MLILYHLFILRQNPLNALQQQRPNLDLMPPARMNLKRGLPGMQGFNMNLPLVHGSMAASLPPLNVGLVRAMNPQLQLRGEPPHFPQVGEVVNLLLSSTKCWKFS